MNFKQTAIPLLENKDFKNKWIPINEIGEKLISIEQLNLDNILSTAMYYEQGIKGALKQNYVREGVAELLGRAAALLPSNYKLIVWDGWRPFEVQKYLYETYYDEIAALNPGNTDTELQLLTSKFVSKPSLDKDYPAPHITGGAVDLAILDEKGNVLDFGTEFDDFSDKANTRYYEELLEKNSTLSMQEKEILCNRRLLYHIMTSVGFSNYPEEWWHFDYGNQWWGQLTNRSSAIYGLVQQG